MVKIATSILSADQTNLKAALDAAAEGGADYIHVDIMDLHFVDNLTIGPSVTADLARHTRVPLDVHLMVEDPMKFARLLAAELKKKAPRGKATIDDISRFSPEAMRMILKSVPMREIALALKGAGETLFKQVIDTLHKDDAADLITKMGELSTVKREEIKAAREKVLGVLDIQSSFNPVRFLVVHQEVCHHLDGVINHIRHLGFGPGVAINPATPVSTIEHVLHLVDLVLVMSVNPGFGGQEFIPYCLDKVRYLRKTIDDRHLNVVIEIDGGIKPDNAAYATRAGCDILVAGAAVFNEKASPAENIKALRDACAITT